MKWYNTAFRRSCTALDFKKLLDEDGIKTGSIFRAGEYWIVPWQPRSETELRFAHFRYLKVRDDDMNMY